MQVQGDLGGWYGPKREYRICCCPDPRPALNCPLPSPIPSDPQIQIPAQPLSFLDDLGQITIFPSNLFHRIVVRKEGTMYTTVISLDSVKLLKINKWQ